MEKSRRWRRVSREVVDTSLRRIYVPPLRFVSDAMLRARCIANANQSGVLLLVCALVRDSHSLFHISFVCRHDRIERLSINELSIRLRRFQGPRFSLICFLSVHFLPHYRCAFARAHFLNREARNKKSETYAEDSLLQNEKL